MVLLAVSQRWPVLLYGPAGAGKTALISKLARDYGSRVLSIHMEEQIDGKTLIGSYVCTEQPGEFRWQPGSLTQAVLKGFWVVFEDIDKAPADMQSILLPLLEGATSFFTGNGEGIRVAEGFRLFSTVSSSKLDISRATEETFERVNQLAGFHYGTLSSLGRFSLRDLLKWCKRIAGLGFCFTGDSLSSYVRHSIYQEAVDIFAAFSTSAENRTSIMKELAKMWSVPISAAETLYPVDKPLIQFRHQKKPFVEVRSSLHVLERTACSVKYNEPVLLVGETGTGKTTVVQNLSMRLAQKLTVLNMSQQSDVADLLGGYKPMDAQFVCIPLYMEFENLFTSTFPIKDNEEFLAHLKKYVSDKNWKGLLSGFRRGVKRSEKLQHSGLGTKRKRPLSEELQKAWGLFRLKLETASLQIGASAGMIFSFVEGAFVNALKTGEWILLDEVNLAPPETLQRVIGVLEEESGSLCLAERGDVEYIHRHPNFRIFACMNPATDAGKRDLPFSIRSRFTEYFVDDVMNDEDLILFVNQFMDDSRSNQELVSNIVRFYKLAKKESEDKLQDGANQKPQYSLRIKTGATNDFLDSYVLTPSVRDHLCNLARAVFIGRYPVLLQGPTSSGKTSLVQFLAATTGREFVRINNHEHTDLQEYLGSYITDSSGRLVFNEGILVKAVRNGHWIVLDELNLAPSDVLEALNRLLDDNRELFVPELRETVPAHPDFMLFATQNPPTLYGGRKMLSRAFRNRFVEIHVDEIPQDELSEILEKRCKVPESYAKKMVAVMKELQLHRQSSKVFAGKHGFITPRDLFRWADRFRTFGKSYEDLARDGYYLLAERLRNDGEKRVVQDVLEKQLRVNLAKDDMYKQGPGGAHWGLHLCKLAGVPENLGNIIWTRSMWRLYFLVERCYKMREPVLLVGETGGGKTTVCQLLSKISSDITQASYTLNQLGVVLDKYRRGVVSHPNVTLQELDTMDQMCRNLLQLHQKWQTIFMWQDGPLVKAMKDADLFLVDEISLADDSVLERLNSVLEPERKLIYRDPNVLFHLFSNEDAFVYGCLLLGTNMSLAEKGGTDLEKIIAHPNFFLLATMNPGGDYGKKELSPALRNRFTEIWVPPVTDPIELKSIAQERIIDSELSYIVDLMLHFWEWFNQLQTGRMLTVRDLLSWVDFIRVAKSRLLPEYAFLHGAFLVLLDGLSLGTGISKGDAADLRRKCLSFLLEELKGIFRVPTPSVGSDINECNPSLNCSNLSVMESFGSEDIGDSADSNSCSAMPSESLFGIHPFYIEKGDDLFEDKGFEFLAPTTRRNALRVLRAMQLPRPVLLEGSPGVGKTSLIVALGKYSGHTVVRINLSEQTDLMDLLGSDLPVESDEGMQFAWSDGILLQVYIEELVEDDYLFICSSLYPSISRPILSKLILFNKRLHEDIMLHHKFGQDGSPWEFNLRDVIRSCQIIQGASGKSQLDRFLNTVYIQRMRTSADRQEVIKLYEQVFGGKPLLNLNPRVQLNPRYLAVGSTYISRHHSQSLRESSGELKILPAQRFSLEAVAHCVQQQWLCILVGPPSSGKTSLIRLLAQLTGNVLNELSLSSTADISELLGCFEQYDAFRNYRLAIARIQCYINEYCNLQMESSSEAFTRREGLITRWLSFLSSIGYGFSTSSTYDESWRTRSFNYVSLLVEIIKCLRLHREKDILPVSWSSMDLDKTLITVRKLQDDHNRRRSSAKFEWVTGLLIKAIENGEWIVLENANLCNPTVLDRINSLVEQSGSITVNECGTVDGKPVVLHPHSQFRMFLTVNPTYGEVSRAMRNRGVEICMMEPYLLLDEARTETELKDVKRFLVLSGIPVSEVIDSMANAHIYARDEGLHLGVTITYLELARWVQLFQRLLTSGNQPAWSLQISWEHTYLSSLGEVEGKEIVDHVKVSYLSVVKLHKYDPSRRGSSCLPGGWPTPLKLRDYVLYSKETSVQQNCMYLEFLASQAASYSVGVALSWLPKEQALNASGGSLGTDLVNLKILHSGMFPKASNDMFITCGGKTESDLARTREVMFIAANWIMEQATESDLQLYLLWFRWFASQLAPICQFFNTYVTSLERELKHPIWDCIHSCGYELMTRHAVDLQTKPIPMLSLGLVDLSLSDEMSKSCSELLENAINSVGLLRRSCQQWDVVCEYEFIGKARYFVPVLRSLRRLEEEVLSLLVRSPSFDVLFQLYDNLLDDHISFWRALTSSQFEYLFISWHSVQKDVVKLQDFCPEVVKDFQEENKNLEEVSSWSFHSQKSLLWVHGGHPFVSSSADVCQKHFELLSLCEMFWRRRTISWDCDSPIDVAVSFMPELRFLAMQVSAKISSFVLEMWFRWHTSLWSHGPALAQNRLGLLVNAALLPDMIFQPIILAHKKSFEADKFSAIKSLLAYAQENLITECDMNLMISLLASSSHHGLTSLIKSFVEPLIGDIYLKSSSTDPVYTVGCAWLRLGGLRYHLLICCDDLDPAVKYSLKYSQLMGKIAALELETEVRKECAHLAGCAPFREANKQRKMLLEKLEAERTRLHRKLSVIFFSSVGHVVFRSDPGKFKKLKYECDEFVKLVTTSVCLAKDADSMNIEALTDHMQNWQETATCFIERLSSEYSGYLDIVQPVQVAIYEMKLGLSLVLSSAFCKEFVDRVDVDDIDIVLGTVYEFVRFPRGCASKAVSIMDESRQGKFSSTCIKFSTNISAIDINLLEKLVTLSRDVNTDETVSDLQMKAVIHQNLLRRVAHSAAEDRFMDNDSFMLLDKIFEEFASSWVKMKVQLKTREDYEAQQYKFRPRAFKIENVIGIDISNLGNSISNESFEEWQELVSEEKPTEEADEGREILEEDWNFLQESLVNDIVNIHNALFGSEDLVQTVSDADRLSSFIDSYMVGIRIIKDLKGLSSSRLDARLVPEHLLRLCLEHEEKFISSPKAEHAYNFYKDSNASLMVKLVEPVLAFQQRILRLLSEWDDHLALQKIMDVIEMILSIPLDTPLAKALSGLQFLLSRVRILQETVSKFPLNDLLEPIFLLVSSWQKLEFESWPALLDDVQAQFETNAGKLWFPLYSVLQRKNSVDIEDYNQSTIQRHDVLQQPVMLIVHQVAVKRGIKTQVVLGPPNLGDSFDQTQLSDNDRCIWWFSTWEKKEEIKQIWYTIEKISGIAIEDAEVWDDENKSSGKRRPLCELLLSNLQNLLESSGLAKHRSTSLKEGMSTGDTDIAALDQLQRSHPRSPETEWKDVNGYHFKSIASLHRLLQIGLNFHKDFNPEQVNRSCSYIDHLIAIQQDQRAAAYDFAEKLKGLRAYILPLESLLSSSNSLDSLNSSNCSFAQNQHELLDLYLLGHNKSITTLEVVNLHQYGVTKRMEQLVHKNFLVIKEFEDHLSVLIKQDVHGVSISGALLGHFKDIFEKGKIVAEEYYSGLQASCPSEMVDSSNHSRLQVRFDEALGAMYSRIVGVYCRVGSWSGRALSDKSFENIPVWKDRFDSNVADLQLDSIRDELIETTQSAVSVMTLMLAEIFTSLYSHGFGISEEDQLDDTGRDKTQDAKGTGMGEGAGLNDVSDQITDEDQLLGTSEKPSEEQDVLNDAPSNNDKGIEMEQDFAAATFSVSEESGDDDDGDDEDEQLESAMGETGTNSEIVDERLWDKDDGDDEKPSSRNEKYESGPSVEDKDPSSRELRARDETTSNADEAGEHDPNEIDTKNDDDNENSEGLDSTESMEDMNVDKEEAFSDPTGLQLDEPNRGSDEDISMDEPESVDPVEDVVPDENNDGPEENTTTSVDDVLNDMEPEEMERNSEQDDPKHKESITEMDSEGPKNDVFEPDTLSNGKSAPQPGCVSLASAFRDAAPESNWNNSNDTQNDLAPMSGLPNATDNEMLVADSSKGGKLSDEQPKTQLPQPDSSLLQKIQPNPCRNVGDALDGWKERAKVSVDLQDENSVEAPVDVGDEDAGEYGFTSETDKGTAQALGPAASDQTDNKINEKKPDGEATTANREEHTEMEVEELPPDSRSVKSNAVNLGNKIEEQMEILNLEKRSEESLDVDRDHDREKMLDSFVSLRRSSMNEIHQLGKLSVSEDSIGKAQNLELLSCDVNANATSLWQRYELLTTRLSQELAEQLRLVMEPTLASKLQGDYKTGKRINMKKVISYIASHYRKDKIWLRRTRPNKRDYQVVIAVDDSRSMSESHCRDVAIEALVTVCRAMSQLEVGNLAVTSFGKKGNIRLLHDFDHPFNREAGVKMLSSLTFNQENTIADEPVGDLLKYLNIMLDTAVANARLPSGHNPLQQLVLIIADGLFHEKKENLKRCVRDILSKKRMVAFLLLDSPEKSIVDLEEVIFQGGKVKFPKYMDSFPFPFYAVVRNIEALPRTLADLLRQQLITLNVDLLFTDCSGLSSCNTRGTNFTIVRVLNIAPHRVSSTGYAKEVELMLEINKMRMRSTTFGKKHWSKLRMTVYED
ncbi:hypothetical protein RJ640_013841 [Escallonia rubra]|uniref:Midasin n=1 Tax=Escallonia rubra TaxID=112253 RepID=A0AA88U9E5_9ASTE|nr:hypothetical protein RJ640_013841 [Escallonia rubra]